MKWRLPGWLRREIRILPKRRISPAPRWMKQVNHVLVILSLVFLTAFVIWRVLLHFEVSGRFAKIRREGLPASGTELNRWRSLEAEGSDGAPKLLAAFDLIQQLPDARSNLVAEPRLLDRTNKWPEEVREAIEDYAELNVPALAKARESFGESHFAFPIDFSFGPDTTLAHLPKFKTLARLGAFQALLAADAGDEQKATAELCGILQTARGLDEEPCIISFLVRCAVIQMAIQAAERDLNRIQFSEPSLERLARMLTSVRTSNLLSRAFIGERAITAPVFRLSRAEAEAVSADQERGSPRPPIRFAGKPNPFLWATGFFDRDLNFFLRTMEQAIALATQSPPASLVLTNAMRRAAAEARRKYYVYSSMLLPSLEKVVVRDVTVQTSLKLALTACAVEQFRQRRGQLPDSLERLTPEFLPQAPTDPFDGQRLRYRMLPRGYVIYSVGADGHDDGGRARPPQIKTGDKSTYDITFIVER